MRVEHVCGVFGQGRGGRRDKGKLRGNEADDGANERRETESLAEWSLVQNDLLVNEMTLNSRLH